MNHEFENLAAQFRDSGRTVGSAIHHFESVTSTMDVAWDLAHTGAADGTVVVADHQTEGRGRFNRSWVSDHGQDILCSVVLRPRASLAGELLMLAAMAVVDVAESFGIDAGIKWPNDVQVNGNKLAGVIAESITGPTNFRSDRPSNANGRNQARESGTDSILDHLVAVIGIGLNVNFDLSNHVDAGLTPTSISAETGRRIDRLGVFEQLLKSVGNYYSELSAGGSIVPAWREKLTTLGREVTVVSGTGRNIIKLHGVAHDVDSSGRLIVRDADGRDWPVSAGEVTVQDIS